MNLIAIQGVNGSYSEMAAREICGADAEILECMSFADTFKNVSEGKAKYAVIPLRNKIVGEIEMPNKLLRQSNLRIFDKLNLEVRHVLIGTQNAVFENLKTVRSHPEALKQCRNFFSKNLNLRQIESDDTASSARRIIEENVSENAAIASRQAAEIYDGKILYENVADDLNNWTTFYLVGR